MEKLAHCDEFNNVQSLKNHSENVAKLSSEFMAKIGLNSIAFLAGILHDAGKESQDFQDMIRKETGISKAKINHSAAGARISFTEFFNENSDNKRISELISVAILSHHSTLCDIISPDGNDDLIKRLNPESSPDFAKISADFFADVMPLDEIKKRFSSALVEFENFNKIVKISENNERKILTAESSKDEEIRIGNAAYFTLGMLQRLLFSSLIDADKLDSALSMKAIDEPKNIDTQALWEDISKKLDAKSDEFKKVKPSSSGEEKINNFRAEISDACKNFAKEPVGIYRLEVPTGGGKTISSFRYAVEHAKTFKKDRIFYISPFISVTDQNAKVLRELVQNDDTILEHHSNVLTSDDGDYSLLTQRWNLPIILTTMVQFLNTLFAGKKQAARRMHSLANSVIIIDEIQTLPMKCIYMLNSALNFLSYACNTTIVLCSATQPLLDKVHQRIYLAKTPDIISCTDEQKLAMRRVNLMDKRSLSGYSYDDLSDFIFKVSQTENSILMVTNMKAQAQNLYTKLSERNEFLPPEKRFKIFHLSTSMCQQHRMDILNKIRALTSKNERVICISTQLIEAGVDISFDCVIRALAGYDSIIQAVGRCNRNGNSACKNVYIVNIKDEDLKYLPDIKIGIANSVRILDEFSKNPEKFDCDLLSKKAVDKYYSYYLAMIEKDGGMRYKIEEKAFNLFDLLSKNRSSLEKYRTLNNRSNPSYPFIQSFKSAGECFNVIESPTISVLVPYGKGKDLIAKINGKCELREFYKLMKEAQCYCVNIYPNEKNRLEESKGIYKLFGGKSPPDGSAEILALEDGYYDQNRGLTLEKGLMEDLIQ